MNQAFWENKKYDKKVKAVEFAKDSIFMPCPFFFT
jgi:hypothetical protein